MAEALLRTYCLCGLNIGISCSSHSEDSSPKEKEAPKEEVSEGKFKINFAFFYYLLIYAKSNSFAIELNMSNFKNLAHTYELIKNNKKLNIEAKFMENKVSF